MTLLHAVLIFSIADNSKPTVSTSSETPKEDVDTVTLSCGKDTSDSVTGYKWYKDNVVVPDKIAKDYALATQKRGEDGSYTCEVTTTNIATSGKSDPKIVKYLCKYHKVIVGQYLLV